MGVLTRVHIKAAMTRCAFSLTFSLVLGGCTESTEPLFANYEYRIRNILPLTTKNEAFKSAVSSRSNPISPLKKPLNLKDYQLPRVRELWQSWPETSISLLDSLKLNRCQAALPAMKKNSTLGKFHSLSQRLLLEAELLIHLPECIQQQPEGSEFQSLLKDALSIKKQHKNAMIWSALFTSAEFREFASLSKGMLSKVDQSVEINGPQALGYWFIVQHQLDRQLPINSYELENALKQLSLNPSLGQWIATSIQAINTLTNTSLHLQVNRDLCTKPIKIQQKQSIQTVFRKYFIGDIQSTVGRAVRLGRQLHNALKELNALNYVLNTDGTLKPYKSPNPLTAYLQKLFGETGLLNRLLSEFKVQVDTWQSLLGLCHLQPGHLQLGHL